MIQWVSCLRLVTLQQLRVSNPKLWLFGAYLKKIQLQILQTIKLAQRHHGLNLIPHVLPLLFLPHSELRDVASDPACGKYFLSQRSVWVILGSV